MRKDVVFTRVSVNSTVGLNYVIDYGLSYAQGLGRVNATKRIDP